MILKRVIFYNYLLSDKTQKLTPADILGNPPASQNGFPIGIWRRDGEEWYLRDEVWQQGTESGQDFFLHLLEDEDQRWDFLERSGE